MSIRPRGLILAAGNGKRLGTTVGPKALLPIDDRTILERQASALASAGVEEIVIVVGYHMELVERHCEAIEKQGAVRFTFVENPRWADTQTVYSMCLAAPYLEGRPTFTLNGDVLFPRSVLQTLRASGRPAALAIDEKLCGAEEVKVSLDADDRLLAIHKGLDPTRATGEFIGVAWFDPEAGARFRLALEEELHEHGQMSYYDYALIRASCGPTHGVRFRGIPMIEIDFPEDLQRAREDVAPRIRVLDAA
jgi:choline kinase